MINYILKKIIGTQNERQLRKLIPIAEVINSLEPEVSKMTDAELRAKTDEFKKRVKARIEDAEAKLLKLEAEYKRAAFAEDKQDFMLQIENARKEFRQVREEILNQILPEAFAVVREVGKRTIGMRHFDVQLMGGIVLHQGKIIEMATGEGKTLVATLPIYLNALTGRGTHIVTVNDYLAKRDRFWMGPIYEFLGLSCGYIQHYMTPEERKKAYSSDVTYGTNNEFGFDYLRDNMVIRKEDMVQRGLNYAIVDEVDSILIDEARTPLIISGPTEESTDKYYKIDKIIPRLEKDKDYAVEEKTKTTALTEEGIKKCESLLDVENLYEDVNIELIHHINQALKAHKNFDRDVDYVVKDGEVLIVDEFTGRLMPGRRYSEGLHQALEAKEGVKIERENQTLATVTFQNYFRMYDKLAGMTGTAETEAVEFKKIYNLDVIVVPTNKPLVRTNYPDVIYKTEREKFNAICDEISALYKKGRPVLVGTISIEKNEKLSRILKVRKIPHHVLNAKYHEREAEIIAQAGRLYAVTIATNMAGRGTDIVLGGNPEFLVRTELRNKEMLPTQLSTEDYKALLEEKKKEVTEQHKNVVELGGLHMLGTERHEARRIDNQLRGRAGRQGDPGSSRFYLSLEDDLMRIFGSDRIKIIMDKFGMEEGQEIQHPLVTKAVETAQKRVESYNFDIRKHLLEYDDVMNRQREIIYEERRTVLESEDLKEHIYGVIEDVVSRKMDIYMNKSLDSNEWNIEGFKHWLKSSFFIPEHNIIQEGMDQEGTEEDVLKRVRNAYEEKRTSFGIDVMQQMEKMIMLQVIDSHWKDHLYSMDRLREGIGLRAYGQRDPLVEYQHEGFEMFLEMIERIKEETLEFLFKVRAVREDRKSVFEAIPQSFVHEEVSTLGKAREDQVQLNPQKKVQAPPQDQAEKPTPYKRPIPKVGRNDPCPCGKKNPKTGKLIKYKFCCYPKYD